METHKQIQAAAKTAEAEKDFPSASKLYESLLKADPLNEKLTNRLMIIYRKMKNYKKELSVINKAIRQEQQHYASPQKSKRKVSELSKKLNISMGLTDKKGKSIVTSDSISRLEKRKQNVLIKLN